MSTKRRLAVTLAAMSGLISATAHAQFDPKDPRAGPELTVDLGFGAFSNRAAFRLNGTSATGTLDGSFGFQATLAYRIIPPFSVGISGGYNLFVSSLASMTTDASGGSTRFGLVVRVHPLGFLANRTGWKLFNPYIGTGFDPFVQVTQRLRTNVAGFPVETLSLSTGTAVPFYTGLDVQVAPNIDVGLMFLWSQWSTYETCVESSVLTRSCDRLSREPEGFFYIGAGIRLHYNPFSRP